MLDKNSVVAVYDKDPDAEQAVRQLQERGFDMKKLSIVGKDYHSEEKVVGYYNAGDRVKFWGKNGEFWGGIWGCLFGAGLFVIPGVGSLVVLGPLVGAIAGALEGAPVLGGISALAAGLYSLGIPKNSVVEYESSIKTGKFLLIVHGSKNEVFKARDVIQTTAAAQYGLHLSPKAQTQTSSA